MIKKLLFDIETTGLLDYKSIDYSSMPYKIKPSYKTHCIVAKDLNTGDIYEFINDGISDNTNEFITLIKQYDIIIGHNIINFDLLSLKLTHKLYYDINPNAHKRLNINDPLENFPDRLFNKPVLFIDTMILSKLLWADRPGGHSLRNLGKIVGEYKGDYGEQQDAWDNFSLEMLSYCRQDVNVNHKVYEFLLSEMGNYAKEWQESYQLESAIADLVTRGEHFGFKFNQELANWCVEDLNSKLEILEKDINSQLPVRKLPKGQQLTFPIRVWKKPFSDVDKPFKATGGLKKSVTDYLNKIGITENQEDYINSLYEKEELDGAVICSNNILKKIPKHEDCLTNESINFCKKINITDRTEAFKKILEIEKSAKDVDGILEYELPELTEPMTVDHIDDLKQHIISLGWNPSKFDERDLLINSKKKLRTREEVLKAIDKYVMETIGSQYEKFRCEFLNVNPEDLREHLLEKTKNAKRFLVLSSPQYTVDQDKNLCPNLERMMDKVPFIKSVIEWMTYRHRRNNILSPNGTGWLTEERLKIDSRIPTPADTLGAATGRFQHKKVCNVARVSTLYGEYMRALFGVEKDHFLLTADADGLENRREGSLVYKYPGGPEYAEMLEAPKPNDWHTLFAKELGIPRPDSKSVKFGLSFGQQINGMVKRLGWTKKRCTEVYNGFWEKAYALKALKDALECHWEANNKDFVIGIDKRKYKVRAKHVLINLVTQGGAVTIMKRQHILLDRMLKERDLLGNPFEHDLSKDPKSTPIIFYHDESSQQVHKDLVRLKSFETKEEAEECKKELEEKGWVLSDINHGIPEICEGKYFIAYSEVITLTSKSMEMAGEYYNQPIKFTQSGQLGLNWSQTH